MQIFGPSELLEDVHKEDLCIGCGACVNLCPYFKNYRGKTAMLFPCARKKVNGSFRGRRRQDM